MIRSVKYGVQVAAVCCVALVVSMLYVSQSGCGCVEIDEDRLTIQLDFASDSYKPIGEELYRDATFNINKITPKDEKVKAVEVRIVIKSSDGSVLNSATLLEPDEPMMYDDGSDGRVDVQFWHIDSDGDARLDAGDMIKITGLSSVYDFAHIQLLKAGERIGSITLPETEP